MKSQPSQKATRIDLFSLKTPNMRVFHLSWLAFFLCFFGWFGIAPMMAVVRDELDLSKAQVGNTIIASVAVTIFARLIIGWLCDKIGPRKTYSGLLVIFSLPVMLIGLADTYETFLIARLAIGVIGASFVITQYHTAVMFAPNVVGTANATTAGWGNLGGGVTQMVMPLIFGGIVALGISETLAWRYAMVVPGLVLMFFGILYYRYGQDYPEGNLDELRKNNPEFMKKHGESKGGFLQAIKDYRVWAMFIMYGACFGIELTMNNILALYFHDDFGLSLAMAGIIAGLFGAMNIFARTFGGVLSDKTAIKYGLKGRVAFLGLALFTEGLLLVLFGYLSILPLAIAVLIIFSTMVMMAEGAMFSIVPFVNKKAVGAIAGIVGAGGNAGAVAAGFLFRTEALTYSEGLMILGICVVGASFLALLVRFSKEAEQENREEMNASLEEVKRMKAEKRKEKAGLGSQPSYA